MHAQREVIDAGLLPTQVVDTDLRVGDTAVEPRLRVGLDTVSISIEFVHDNSFSYYKFEEQVVWTWACWFPGVSPQSSTPNGRKSKNTTRETRQTHLVLAVAVAPRRTTGHLDGWKWKLHFLRTVDGSWRWKDGRRPGGLKSLAGLPQFDFKASR